jgi:hypothetical protein
LGKLVKQTFEKNCTIYLLWTVSSSVVINAFFPSWHLLKLWVWVNQILILLLAEYHSLIFHSEHILWHNSWKLE